jgi:hypothetical protein
MSELSRRNAPSITFPSSAIPTVDGQDRSTPRVAIWAFFGGAVLLLQLYVWFRWITGPYFVRVLPGPDDPPLYMKAYLYANAIVLAVGLPFALWFFLVKPWLRERRITLDGMLVGSMGLMFFQDPLLNYFNTWCVYNAWAFNLGSWTSHIPGWVSPEEPGLQVPEPLAVNVTGYMYGVLLITIVGCWIMRWIKTRWPAISNLRLILVTYAIAFVFDFVMEGLVLLPLGLYSYPGAIRAVSINAGTYYQWPIYEGFMWGAVQTGFCCLRFFTDDRGQTVVERGLERVGGGAVKQQLTRFLAIFAAVSALFFFLYNVPAQWMGMHADPWPEDVLKRSYFSGYVCGEGSNLPCPDPILPIPTKRSGYINKQGELVLPEGKQFPEAVPVDQGT